MRAAWRFFSQVRIPGAAGSRGFALATVGLITTLAGTFIGGILTTTLGLGHSLWVFGLLQIFSNIGYVIVARADTVPFLMYSATGFENFTSGLGTGAFSVLLLRMTQKRFSATQYALFSSLFGLPRVLSGPISGFVVDAAGWELFFWGTMAAGIPGLLLLQRFVPIGTREPEFQVRPPSTLEPLSAADLAMRGAVGGAVSFLLGAFSVASLRALKAMRGQEGAGFDVGAAWGGIFEPAGIAGWLTLGGLVVLALVMGLVVAAVFAARHGAARGLESGNGAD